MIVVEHPCFGHIMLNACIKQGRGGKRDEKVSGVGREDVAKEEDVRLLSTVYLVKQCRQRNGEEDAEKAKMADAEEVDELRNGVVWHHTLDEVVLMHPTHRELVASQLHPHTVNRVFGNDKCLSYNELVVSIDAQLLASGIYREVVKGLAALQMKAVGREHEVVAHLIKRRIFLAVIAGGEEKARR